MEKKFLLFFCFLLSAYIPLYSQCINDPLDATVAPIMVSECNGNTNGVIQIMGPAGGSGSYQYSIDGATTWLSTPSFTHLSAGIYNVQLRDALNTSCVKVLNSTLYISEPPTMGLTVSSTPVTPCYGNANGSIILSSPKGGSGSYEYSMDEGLNWKMNGIFEGIVAGSYRVKMRDIQYKACQISLFATVGQPQKLSATVNSTNVTGCHGYSNGSINITKSMGGSGSYQYNIQNGNAWSNVANFQGLTAKVYKVNMRDKNNFTCQVTIADSLVIHEPVELSAAVSQNNISCHGANDGSISVQSPIGGSYKFEFSIDQGITWQQSNFPYKWINLKPGPYMISMRDQMEPGCMKDLAPTVLIEPAEIKVVENTITPSCIGSSNGSATLNVSGGDGGIFIYAWGPYGGTEATATGLAVGKYSVKVMDKNCSVVKDLFIPEATCTEIQPNNVKDNIRVYPNPAKEILYIENYYKNTEVVIFNLQGVKVYAQKNIDAINLSGIAKGMYIIRMSSIEGEVFKKLEVE